MFCAACGGQGDDEPCACGNDRALAGRYHIVRPLGPLPRGGSPWALLRLDDQAELVGTEVLAPTSAADPAACALRAGSLRELGPGLPQVVDHTISGIGRTRSLWLITEPVPGVVPRGPQPEEVVLGWVDDLCRVLGPLHARGRTHGRVASAARIAPDGAVLADLGAAWDELGGGPAADAGAAPEQLGGRTDARTDLYGLAAAALGWLTGYTDGMTDRRTRYRAYIRALDPTADPEQAFDAGSYLDGLSHTGRRVAARLEIEPTSAHLVVGGLAAARPRVDGRDRGRRVQRRCASDAA